MGIITVEERKSGRSAAAETTLQTNACPSPSVVWLRHRICTGSCNFFLMQGDAPSSARGARAGHKRRAAGTTPVAAELPPGGLILPVGQVPVLSFGGENVIDPADYKAVVDAAVHRLGRKTIANALVLLVEHEVAAARAQAAPLLLLMTVLMGMVGQRRSQKVANLRASLDLR